MASPRIMKLLSHDDNNGACSDDDDSNSMLEDSSQGFSPRGAGEAGMGSFGASPKSGG